MNKIGIFGATLALLAVIGLVWMSYSGTNSSQSVDSVKDYKNATFMMDGKPITLANGVSEVPTAPGTASMETIKYFGNEAKGDINGDGIPDMAFLITRSGGGSGTFYYVVGAVQNQKGGYQGTDAVLLGDRIAPQTTEIKDGKVIVNYADRKSGEPMSAKPTEGKSLWLKLDTKTMQFGIVVQNFEGESR